MKTIAMDKAVVHIDSDKGRFEWVINPGSPKEVSEAFMAIGRYLKSANHAKTGLKDISLKYTQTLDGHHAIG